MLVLTSATPALADATVFVGNASSRASKGLSLGVGLLVVGFEFEFADVSQSADDDGPGLRTGMGNVLLQTPVAIYGLRPYFTTGGGVYRERLDARQETHFGVNTGGGVKISLLGPVRARVDYRVFNLQGDPLHSTVHRVYAGINIAF